MRQELRTAALLLLVLTVTTGVAYPLLVTGLGAALFPSQAHGSLLAVEGRVVGSERIGQPFTDPGYFWGRPSATAPPCNGIRSGGSNLGPTNPALEEAVRARIRALREADPGNGGVVPVDLVTASGSGLDPDISPAAALYQVPRVARARGIQEARLRALVRRQAEGRQLGFLGEPRVNVLYLNLALDGLAPGP